MQSQEQPKTTQLSRERNVYRTPKLVRYGKLASLVEGGATASAFESVTQNTSGPT